MVVPNTLKKHCWKIIGNNNKIIKKSKKIKKKELLQPSLLPIRQLKRNFNRRLKLWQVENKHLSLVSILALLQKC
jgi:hypothetical protein